MVMVTATTPTLTPSTLLLKQFCSAVCSCWVDYLSTLVLVGSSAARSHHAVCLSAWWNCPHLCWSDVSMSVVARHWHQRWCQMRLFGDGGRRRQERGVNATISQKRDAHKRCQQQRGCNMQWQASAMKGQEGNATMMMQWRGMCAARWSNKEPS